jgi:hypothetical protein
MLFSSFLPLPRIASKVGSFLLQRSSVWVLQNGGGMCLYGLTRLLSGSGKLPAVLWFDIDLRFLSHVAPSCYRLRVAFQDEQCLF